MHWARKRIDSLYAERQHVRAQLRDERAALRRSKLYAKQTLEAQAFLQRVAQQTQQQAHKQIAAVVTKCLRQCGWDYDFRIRFERKRGRTEANLVFLRQGKEVSPKDASGGGPLDVAAFALRVACLMLARPRRRRLLVLDEPFRFVHGAKHQRNCAKMVETLADDLGVQFVVVTGLEWLRIGKVIEIGSRVRVCLG